MEILFLGTSSGTPTKTRNMSALALRLTGSKHWSLIDCGEATQHRILQTSLSLATLRAVFITHLHGDHCYGLPGLLASAGMLNRTEALMIAGPQGTQRFVECVLDTTGLDLPYPLRFVDAEDLGTTRALPDLDVQATALSHRVPSFAYSFTERTVENRLDVTKLNRDGISPGPIWSDIQHGNDTTTPEGRILLAREYLLAPRKARKVIVGGDNDAPALLAQEAVTADVLVHEATYTEEILAKVGPGPQHSSAKRVARFAQEAGINNLVLTHFSPRYQQNGKGLALSDLEAEARSVYHGKLFLADDLDRYVLNKDGVLTKA
jgi:ribonuclease Z